MPSFWLHSGSGNTITNGPIRPLGEYLRDSYYRQLNPLLKNTVINGGIIIIFLIKVCIAMEFQQKLKTFIKHSLLKYYFVHIPKNGGMTVREYFKTRRDVYLSKHFHHRYRDTDTKFKNRLKYFSIVRNPWSRTASRFVYSKERAPNWSDDDQRKNYILNVDFDQFVRDHKIIPGKAFPDMPWMGPMSSWQNQLEWITDEQGNVCCDCLRFEHLTQDLTSYFDQPIALTASNVTKTKYDYREMYTDETAQIIAELFSDDISHFGFTFDSPAKQNIVI